MKDMTWRTLVFLVGILPRAIRVQLCRLSFAASARGDVVSASTELLTLQEDLRWHINEVAVRYGHGVHPKHRLTDYHNFFVSHLREGERVLDVGCGYGTLSDSMAGAGAFVLGIDFNAKSIKQARERYNNLRLTFIIGDITHNMVTEDIDTVVLSNVLEHIDNRCGLLRQLNESLQPQRFLIRVPMMNRDWLVYFRKELGLPYFSDPTHFIEYTVGSFNEEMDRAGLSVSEYEIKWGELYAEVVSVQ